MRQQHILRHAGAGKAWLHRFWVAASSDLPSTVRFTFLYTSHVVKFGHVFTRGVFQPSFSCLTAVLGTKIASIHAPSSTLATEYYGFSSGSAIVSMALQVLSGYNMDVLQSSSGQQWVNRYQWGWRMLVSCSVASTSVLAPTRYAHIAGILSGLIMTWIIGYIVQPSWGRRAGLSLKEILIQCGLLGISLFSYPFLDRHAQYTQESF